MLGTTPAPRPLPAPPQVAAVLQDLGLTFVEEAVLTDAGGYSVDMLLKGGKEGRLSPRTVVEVDGPTHFVRRMPDWRFAETGSTILKHSQLRVWPLLSPLDSVHSTACCKPPGV